MWNEICEEFNGIKVHSYKYVSQFILTSDTRRQEAYEDRSILMKRSFANTSSFLTSSPWMMKQTINKSKIIIIFSDLDICVPRGPEQVGDAGPAHRSGHGLAGGLDAGQELGEITCRGCQVNKRSSWLSVIPSMPVPTNKLKPIDSGYPSFQN